MATIRTARHMDEPNAAVYVDHEAAIAQMNAVPQPPTRSSRVEGRSWIIVSAILFTLVSAYILYDCYYHGAVEKSDETDMTLLYVTEKLSPEDHNN